MKNTMMILGLSSIIALTGCQYGASPDEKDDLYEQSGNTINVSDRNELYNESDKNNNHPEQTAKFGFVRHQNSPIPGEDGDGVNNIAIIDREAMANLISKLTIQLPTVEDVATLVTDEEVFIAYATNTKDRKITADQVKKTGISIVPRWYHVYVADNPRLIEDLESYSGLSSASRDADAIIENLVDTMKNNYPQGDKIDAGENENGEPINSDGEMVDEEKGNHKADINLEENGFDTRNKRIEQES